MCQNNPNNPKSQKSPIPATKRPINILIIKNLLPAPRTRRQNIIIERPQRARVRRVPKRPIPRDLFLRQKRPIPAAKETYSRGKRDLFMWNKDA